MRRTAVIVAVLLAILWQTVAMARVGSTVNPLADLAHAVLHWQGESHHHHDDGSYHADESAESVQHVAIDPVSATLAVAAPALADFPPLTSAAPEFVHAGRVPSPALDGLLRPPRLHA